MSIGLREEDESNSDRNEEVYDFAKQLTQGTGCNEHDTLACTSLKNEKRKTTQFLSTVFKA